SAPAGANGTMKRATRTGQAFCASLRNAEQLPMSAKRRKFLRLTNLKLPGPVGRNALPRIAPTLAHCAMPLLSWAPCRIIVAPSCPADAACEAQHAVDGPRARRSRSPIERPAQRCDGGAEPAPLGDHRLYDVGTARIEDRRSGRHGAPDP